MDIKFAGRYSRFIDSQRSKPWDGYTELHHILPRCLGGNDDPSNLIRLSARAHFIAHVLLSRAHPNHKGLSLAVVNFKNSKRAIKVNSRLFAAERERFSELMKVNNPMQNPKIAKKMGNSAKGRTPAVFSESSIKGMRDSKLGSNNPNFKIPPWLHGRATDETRSIWAEAQIMWEFWNVKRFGYHKMAKAFDRDPTSKSITNMVTRFETGWIPVEDPAWVSWHQARQDSQTSAAAASSFTLWSPS